ncbi:secretoglobin family 1D member 2-like [Mustela nigripes]|uniref:secretoglobin family 1D member 2-like n=1 Tax=Mustela nigripes TaxID=77151 RepID=UPI00281619B5|nr:secretoglobin family 1D member 2-like [Mustela nigripes]
MKLFLSVLLVTLALYCYEANAITCPALVTDMTGFLLQEKNMYEKTLEKYNAPPEIIEAKMKVKACTDEMSFMSRMLIQKALTTSNKAPDAENLD